MSFHRAWWQRGAASHCGAGSAAMPFVPGNIEAGSSLAIPSSPSKPAPSSIFTNAFGRALHWAPTTIFRRRKDQHSGSSLKTADFASRSAPPHQG